MPPHAVPPHADKNTPQTTHQRANIKYHERRQPDARTKRHDDVNLLEDVRPRRLPVRRHAPIRRKRHNLARQILPRFPIRHTLNHRKPARPHPTTSMPWAGLDEDVSRRETTMRVDASERVHANPHQDIRPPAPHRGRRDDGTTPSTQTQTHTTASSHHRIITHVLPILYASRTLQSSRNRACTLENVGTRCSCFRSCVCRATPFSTSSC